jgi:hypothetical protein
MIDGSNNNTAVDINEVHKYQNSWASDEDLSQMEHNEGRNSIRSFSENINENNSSSTGWLGNNAVSRWFFGSNQEVKKNHTDDRTYY